MKRSHSRTAKQAIALLSDPEFREDVRASRGGHGEGESEAEAVEAAEKDRNRKLEEFRSKWGPIITPRDGLLLDPDERRPEAAAVLAGRVGLIRVFPFTTEAGVLKEFRRLHRVIRRAERETKNERKAELAQWLKGCGFSDSAIAAAVWGRSKGLKRKRDLGKADELVGEYLRQGFDYDTANRKAMAAATESEAKAVTMVRMARSRHEQSRDRQRKEFLVPIEADPLSASVLKIVGAKFPTHPVPFVPPASAIGERLDPLLDDLRIQLIAPSRV